MDIKHLSKGVVTVGGRYVVFSKDTQQTVF